MADVRKILRHSASTTAQIFAGATTALVPITTQALAARSTHIEAQAALALSIGVGAFLAAVLSSTILETRLTSKVSRPLSYVPRWSTVAGLVGCAGIVLSLVTPIGLILGTPLVMTALALGRTHGVIAHRWKSESQAGLAMLVGSLGALLLMFFSWQLGIILLTFGTIFAIVIRAAGQPTKLVSSPTRSDYAKVAFETTVTASVPLVLNVLVFALLTNPEAVAFRMLLSVLGVLQPLLGFLRTRLLVSRSASLIGALSSASLAALLCIVIAHLLGLFTFVLGSAWGQVSTATLVAACLWKVASIPPTVPFSELRRGGHLDALLRLRIVTSILFITAGTVSLWLVHSLFGTFVALCITEAVCAVIYFVVAARVSDRSQQKDPL